MDRQSAINLIRETFENSFEKNRYVNFIRNLFNKISLEPFEYYGQYIPDTFKQYINKYERVGRYTAEGKRIDILIVYLNKETSIERARTMQRNFVAGYLTGKYGSDTEKDAAVVAFVPACADLSAVPTAQAGASAGRSPGLEDWRFSLVKMEYKLTQTKTGRPKGEEEFTPARRFSFLVGKNEPNHTAQQQLLPILQDDENNPTLEQIEKAFSVEKVTKEFLIKYRELYYQLKDSIDRIVKKDKHIREEFAEKKINTSDFSKKLLGQIVFLYFLQKKGWLGVPKDPPDGRAGKNWGEGDRNFLRSLFNKCIQEKKNFFNDYLELLFYNTLNNPRLNQADTTYSEYFDCRIPFLNGGLFEPINNYDWKRTDIMLPNELFSNNKKTKEGDIGSGILDVFDRYNFTVQEDEPLEKEVALDPELLGKVFENLIEENLRKGQGAYYTPREIVHYMCQESLINYLETELEDLPAEASACAVGTADKSAQAGKVNRTDIEMFIKYGEHIIENERTALEKEQKIKSGEQKVTTIKSKMPESIKNNAKLIDEKLANIRVCDPAVGSGAFPIGMMLEIVKARNVLTNYIVTQPSWLSNNQNLQDDIYFDRNQFVETHKRNLPHWEQQGKAYFVTFGLYDSIPKESAEKIQHERENWLKQHKVTQASCLNNLSKENQFEYYRLFSKRYDELLDNGYGSCVLANSKCKRIVEDTLMHFNNERYYLDKYVVMPNHVHAIVIPKEKWTLSQIVHSWKSYSANQINKFLNRQGELWMHESFDHIIRSYEQLERIRKYIEDNPKVTQPYMLSYIYHKQDACDTDRTPYNFKRHCIENCLYGVDIDSSAIDIAKLRFWLSLVVDEEDVTKIKPLPNLDYKLVCGNSLLGVERDLLNYNIFEQLEELKPKYFNETDTNKKLELKKQIDKLIKQIVIQPSRLSCDDNHKQDACDTFDFEVYFSEVFHEKKGFDVVIANPPYVGHKGGQKKFFQEMKKTQLGKRFNNERMDIFYYFFHKALDIGKDNSIITFITTNYYITADSAIKLRTDFKTRTNITKLINFNELKIFESALGQHNIITFLIKNPKNENECEIYSTKREGVASSIILKQILEKFDEDTTYSTIQQSKIYDGNNNYIRIFDRKSVGTEQILSKIKNNSKNLIQICDISQGIVTGLDRISKKHIKKFPSSGYNEGEGCFVLDKDEIKTIGNSPIIKPWFKNSDIKKYKVNEKANHWFIHLHTDLNLNEYKNIYRHIMKFERVIKSRNFDSGELRKAKRLNKWWALASSRKEFNFNKPKIVSPQRSLTNTFGYTEKPWYASADVYFIVEKNNLYRLKYILSLLNSRLYYFWLYYKGKHKGNMLELYLTPLSEIPIKDISSDDQQPFIDLVDKILAITKDKDYLDNPEKQAKVKEYERQIDKMVYKLYGLTDEEIRIVEGDER